MQHSPQGGRNRTGLASAPKNGQDMIDAARDGSPTAAVDGESLALTRALFAREAEPVGTVPSTSAKGPLAGLRQRLKNQAPALMIDKLSERLAFVRTAARLYEALASKCLDGVHGGRPTPAELLLFRDQERAHFELVRDVMVDLGADPTVQTPSADLGGVESMGLLQVLSDPRTTLGQGLHAILVAELTDCDGWRLLIELAQERDLKDAGHRFGAALVEEEFHLQQVRLWLGAATRAEGHLLGGREHE